MTFVEKNEIIATDYHGNKIQISYRNVKNLQQHLGLNTIEHNGIVMAGHKKEFIKIVTFDEKIFEIPRSPENDTEILNFLLGWRRT